MNYSSISPIVYDYSAIVKPETAPPLVRQFGLEPGRSGLGRATR